MRQHYLLGEVAKVLGLKPHQITYRISSLRIDEPETRLGGKRLFSVEDVERIGRYFRRAPNWAALERLTNETSHVEAERLALRPPYEVCQVSETGHEVRDADGLVFAWASDRAKALVLAGLLEAAARG